MHPAAVAILEHEDVEDLDCREDTGPDSALEREGPSRASNFRLAGSFVCSRRVFSSNERDPFITRALTLQSGEAKRVASSLKRKTADRELKPLAVVIEGVDDSELSEKISAIYRQEVSAALGPGQVRRSADENPAPPILRVRVRRVDLANKMTEVYLDLGKGGLEI